MYAGNASSETTFAQDRDAVGKEFPMTDVSEALPVKEQAVPADKVHAWISEYTDLKWPLKLLILKQPAPNQKSYILTNPAPVPFSQEVVKVIEPSEKGNYTTIWRSEMGACQMSVVEPLAFLLQTPVDGGPFCSFALMGYSRSPTKGLYCYSDDLFEPSKVLENRALMSGWRSNGFQILVLPVAFLRVHHIWLSQQLVAVNRRISEVEDEVSKPRHPDDDSMDAGKLTHILHEANATIANLERRERFQQSLVVNVERFASTQGFERTGSKMILTESLAAAKSFIAPQSDELKALTRRVENQRTMIFNLIVQRDQRLNLQIGRINIEIAETSRKIAEYSVRDAASMKTIAILTMIFLPGTAIASFFSMTMFNWSPGGNSGSSAGGSGGGNGDNSNSSGGNAPVASPYLWVYFIIATPLTFMVVGIWWFTFKRRANRQKYKFGTTFELGRSNTGQLDWGSAGKDGDATATVHNSTGP